MKISYRKASIWAALIATALVFASTCHGQTFTVTASPSSLTIYPGQQNIPVTVAVNSGDNDSDNYQGPVVVTMAGLPSGVTVTPVTLTPGSTGTMMLNASPAAGQEGFPSTIGPSPNTSWTAQATVVGAAGATQVSLPFPLTVSISNSSFVPKTVNLPIVNINTSGVPVINKTTDVPGTVTITSADGQTSYLPNSSDSDNTATFHVHGNTTSVMPKLSYNIKLNTSLDLLSTMGLSCGYESKGKPACDKSKTYILLANYDDKTFLRDWSASALANAIPYGGDYLSPAPIPAGYSGTIPTPSGTSTIMPWAPHSLFVELYLNGVYEGNYQLIEKVNVDSHRINITEMSDSSTSGDALTGGYQLEIDHENGEDYMFTTPQGVVIGLVDPDPSPDPEVPEQTGYITNYVNTAETALFSSNFTDSTLGWRAYYDEASAINFYIVNDMMGNVDGGLMYSSDYLYKDINNPFLYMGPIWDFDISSGNVNYESIINPTTPWMQVQAPWYAQWFKDPGFKADVVTQWNALKNNGVFTAWIASIQQQAASLEQSQANNFSRWPIQGLEVWPNPQTSGSYDAEVAYLTNWLQLRIAYLDSQFNGKTQSATTLAVSGGTGQVGSPVTLTAEVSTASSPAGTVSFLSNGTMLGTVALSGNSANLKANNLRLGSNSVLAVYSGDDHNGLSTSNPQAITVTAAPTASVTSLEVLTANPSHALATQFTVSVLGTFGSATPTGSITLMANGTSVAAGTLGAAGTASISAKLPVGSVSMAVAYGGDSNFLGSTSNLIPLVVTPEPPADFTLTGPGSTTNVDATTPGTATLTLSPLYGFNQAITLSCITPPPGVSCAFSPASVTPSGGNATSTLTVSIAGNLNETSHLAMPMWSKVGGGLAMAMLLWPFRRRRVRILLAIVAVLTIGLAVSACGSSTKPFTTTYPLNVSATGGGITHNTYLHIVVTR